MSTKNAIYVMRSGHGTHYRESLDGLNDDAKAMWIKYTPESSAAQGAVAYAVKTGRLDICIRKKKSDLISLGWPEAAIKTLIYADDGDVAQPSDAAQPSEDTAAENNALITELAAIRAMFPIPQNGSPLEKSWRAAMSDPICVYNFVADCLAAQPIVNLTDERAAFIKWAESRTFNFKRSPDGGYYWDDLDAAWQLWQSLANNAQPRVELTDERIMDVFSKFCGWPSEKYPLTESDVLQFSRALLANTAQGKPEQDLHSDALDIYEKMASDPAFEMTCMDGTTNVVGAIKYALAAKKG